MKTVKSNKEARELINKGIKKFRLEFSPVKKVKDYFVSLGSPTVGIMIEAGETMVLVTLIVTVGSVVAYGLYKGFSVTLKKEGKNWYLVFKQIS